MKITDAICELENIRQEHGDITLLFTSTMDGSYQIFSVDELIVESLEGWNIAAIKSEALDGELWNDF